MSDRKDLPTPKSTNFEARVRETLMTYLGRTGDPLDRGVTLRDLLDSGLAALRPGRTATSASVGGASLPIQAKVQEIEPDLTPAPAPTGFSVSAGINMLFIQHDTPQYTQGHGHLRTRVYGKIVNQGDPLPVFADATEITQFTGTIHSYPSNPSTQWRLWIKWETADGVLSVSPAGGTNGLEAGTTTIRGVDLGPLIVEAGNLASGAVNTSKLASDAITAGVFAPGYQPLGIVATLPSAVGYTGPSTVFQTSDSKIYRFDGVNFTSVVDAIDITGTITGSQIADGAISGGKFASGTEPISIVNALPTSKTTSTVFLSTDGKLYRWNGTAYVATVASADISGTIANAQIEGVAASKVTGQLTDTQIADVAAAKLTGTIASGQIASGAVSATKFASGIEPISIVNALPSTKTTSTVFLSTDGKLYRWDGSAYVASVPTSDLSGAVSNAQIADVAASKITGQVADSQVASLAASKLTGEITESQVANAAISAAKFASGIEPVGVVSVLPAVSGYTGPKTVMLTTDSKLYRFTGTAWTAVVEAVDIDSRGLDIKDTIGNVVFASDGEIASTAYVDVNSNNVLISTIAANSLVPSLNYVGAYSAAPTSATLGAAWKQNAVYKNTLNGKSYVLTGTPLAWVEYLSDGQLFLLTIESTNGTIFRVGQSTSTSLHARLFKNGAEVTSETPASWFRWRRVSAIPQAPPNDDATWNANYVSGFKSVSVNVDSVFSRATFFCDIIET